MRNRNVLISGAGPAGMMLAYWLRRHGFSPTVVERAPAPRDGGQAVDVRGAAIEVAGRTGILDELRRARTGTRGMSYVNSTGKSLASMNAAFGVIDCGTTPIAATSSGETEPFWVRLNWRQKNSCILFGRARRVSPPALNLPRTHAQA